MDVSGVNIQSTQKNLSHVLLLPITLTNGTGTADYFTESNSILTMRAGGVIVTGT